MPQPIATATSTPSTRARPPAAVESPEAWKAASRKTAVSSPSRSTAKKAIATSAQAEPSASAWPALARSVAGEAARVPAHPDDHERDHADRDRRDDRLEAFLLALRQRLVEDLQADRDADAQRDREQDTGPHGAKRVRASLLAQERGDDAYDQRRLDAFAQPDHERRQHDSIP